jgi:hypothetical protein
VAGGIGGAIKSTIGLVLLGILTNAFNMLRIDSLVSYLPTALLGIIIVSILWLDSYSRKRKREAVEGAVRHPLEPTAPGGLRRRRDSNGHFCPPFGDRKGFSSRPRPLYGEHRHAAVRSDTGRHMDDSPSIATRSRA